MLLVMVPSAAQPLLPHARALERALHAKAVALDVSMREHDDALRAHAAAVEAAAAADATAATSALGGAAACESATRAHTRPCRPRLQLEETVLAMISVTVSRDGVAPSGMIAAAAAAAATCHGELALKF